MGSRSCSDVRRCTSEGLTASGKQTYLLHHKIVLHLLAIATNMHVSYSLYMHSVSGNLDSVDASAQR